LKTTRAIEHIGVFFGSEHVGQMAVGGSGWRRRRLEEDGGDWDDDGLLGNIGLEEDDHGRLLGYMPQAKKICLTWMGLFQMNPTPITSNFILFFIRYIPFSGGPRKCVGDQFAMMEAILALSIFLQKMEFELVPDQKINMTTGATIHTTSVIFLH
ncbi:carotene epsilon-monooxygenase, chloroplastic, partial [Tanacetum coccineum]